MDGGLRIDDEASPPRDDDTSHHRGRRRRAARRGSRVVAMGTILLASCSGDFRLVEPQIVQVCQDVNAALAICFPSVMPTNCAATADAGSTCTNQNDILLAVDRCSLAVHVMSDCSPFINCITTLPACMH